MNQKITLNSIQVLSLIISILLGLITLYAGLAQAANSEQASSLVKTTTNHLLQALKQRKNDIQANPELIYDLANEIAVPYFDFTRITQYSMGRFWRQASADQRRDLTHEFQTLLVHTYAKALLNYSGQEIRLLPQRDETRPDKVQVNTEVEMPNGQRIPINYLMYLNNGNWKAYDVVIDGVSLVTNYRGSFAEEINRGGIPGLIQSLKNRNQNSNN